MCESNDAPAVDDGVARRVKKTVRWNNERSREARRDSAPGWAKCEMVLEVGGDLAYSAQGGGGGQRRKLTYANARRATLC